METHAADCGGVIHCYSYAKEMAKEYVDMGFYIGVGGVITFKNGRRLKETVEAIPLSRIVLETDCPYLSPEPNRGKRNDSTNLIYVAREIAAIKGISEQKVIEETEKMPESYTGWMKKTGGEYGKIKQSQRDHTSASKA